MQQNLDRRLASRPNPDRLAAWRRRLAEAFDRYADRFPQDRGELAVLDRLIEEFEALAGTPAALPDGPELGLVRTALDTVTDPDRQIQIVGCCWVNALYRALNTRPPGKPDDATCTRNCATPGVSRCSNSWPAPTRRRSPAT